MKLWKRIAVVPGVLAAGAVLLGAWTGWRSEAHLTGFQPAYRFATAIPTDPASIARGAHIARTRGCFGCHGKALEGEVFDEQPFHAAGRTVAPNIGKLAKAVDPAALEAAIRQGIGHDGRALYAMPSYNFVNLTDADTAALIAYLRAAPVKESALPAGYLGWKPRWEIATGNDAAIPVFIGQTPLLAHKADPRPEIRLGEYLAMTSCNECHGFGLRGDDPWSGEDPRRPPDLAGARGYARADFIKLMRTGVPVGGRKLRLMDEVARGRFAHWTDEEVNSIYAYLAQLGQ
ncbi:MAG: c-type cytochrome [Pseudomonadota bacterium]